MVVYHGERRHFWRGSLFEVFKYTGQDFSLWKVQMHIAFENKELMEVADGTVTLAEAKDNDAWKKMKNAAKWLITTAVDTEHLAMIVRCKTAADMSGHSLTIHEQVSSASEFLFIQNFVDCKYQTSENLYHSAIAKENVPNLREISEMQQEEAQLKIQRRLPKLRLNN